MTVTNVSTFGSLQTLIQNISQVQNDLNTDEVSVSSGEKSQTYQGLDGNVEQFTALNSQVARLTNFSQGNSVALSGLQTSNTALSQITTAATSLKSLIASQLSGTASVTSFNQQLQSQLASIASELNTTFEGKYIFGGTQTGAPPVKTPVPAAITPGTPDTAYYQGSQQNVTLRIADDQTIDNNVRADNPAFQQIIAGVNQALQANGSTDALKSAENLVSSGIDGVISLQASVNANIVGVQQVNGQNQTFQTYYTSLTQTMSQSDVVSLSTKVAQDQTVLQASYSTYARISSLSLANYLK